MTSCSLPRHALAALAWFGAAALATGVMVMDEKVAAADEEVRPATFALIIGSNGSVDADLHPLKYADDDAARYLELFRLLGARTYVLSRLDDNTRRLHPQAAAEALEPRRAVLERTLAQLALDVEQARSQKVETELYFVYAGHGNVNESGEGYITLEDMRITGADLARMVGGVPVSRVHIIADACSSYYLAYSRGPGGGRRPVHGFQQSALANDPRVGLLLSTSSARESHEWDEYQAGIFSHEVRSGLYGAADANGDGRVSYREIAAFVSRANAAIPNEKYRPDVHVKAPAASDALLDLRRALTRRLDVDGAHAAHYWMEDERGVRLLDFHSGPHDAVHLVRPPPSGHIYLRRTDDDAELEVPAWPSTVAIADVQARPARVASRGAAHEAFGRLFALPFDETTVNAYVEPKMEDDVTAESKSNAALSAMPTSIRTRTVVGWSAMGLGAAALGTGVVLSVAAINVSHGTSASTSESSAAERNSRISTYNAAAPIAYVVGGVGVVAGVAVLLWPELQHVRATASSSGGYFGYAGTF